ncbi:MAG: hypothetical protein JWR72_1811 [Flavisolibacter sp.]|nr:hypothetical protein [Flavisolibacter sp.]
MKRRDFIKKTSAASAPLLLNGLPLFASESTGNQLFDMMGQSLTNCGKVLVIIQQNGGNDGLNMILPIDKYAELNAVRSNIMVAQSSILPLNGSTATGMHPAMTALQNLYNNGKMTIVQGVSYPNPNFSHFRATDIWFSGSASNEYLDTGWLGRELDITYPNYPQAYPLNNIVMADPLAVQIGSTLPFSLQGPSINMGYNVSDPASLLQIISETTDPAPNNDYGRELTFLRLMKDQSNIYREKIQIAYNAQLTLSSQYPVANTNKLADQLKIVARLIGGGLKTPIYIVNHPNSHDTHENQVSGVNNTAGTQANNLGILSNAIGAFQNDIDLMGKGSKVSGMTFSEFGRRIKSNDSIGTDHGTAAPVLFFGAAVQGGILGTSPMLPATITVSTQLPMQFDFRQLYATVMQDWLCLTPTESQTVLGSSFTKVPIFNSPTLPLEGVSLTGQYYQGQSHLTCKAEQNQKYKWYALEFSTDDVRFFEVKRSGTSNAPQQETYSYTHTAAAPKMFYRIAAQDQQGKIDYSNTVMLRASDKLQLIRVYPNPVQNYTIHVELFEVNAKPVDITIYDLIGAKVYYNRFTGGNRRIDFRVPPSFSKETHYILEVSYGDTKTREQIIFR